jgi:ribonuclease BN (tRNA processing enzyme)
MARHSIEQIKHRTEAMTGADATVTTRRDALVRLLCAGASLPLRHGLGAVAGAIAIPASRAFGQVPAEGAHLVLLGTQGGPNLTSMRGECASAVVVDGETYMVDCGYGAMMALVEAGLRVRDVANIFITHLHDDHIADLAALLSHQWTDGRIEATQVIGPWGTAATVDAAVAFTRANADIRFVDEARSVRPEEIIGGRDIEALPTPTEVFADDRVRVMAVENTHFPEYAKERMPYRSVSYRFDTADRSIVFSGDTTYSENLIELARGVDIFVCETIEVDTLKRSFDARVAAGAYADNAEGIWAHIVGTHASTVDVGRMAAAADVGTVVLTHLLPGSLLPVEDSLYLEGIRQNFDGEIIVGRDGLVI